MTSARSAVGDALRSSRLLPAADDRALDVLAAAADVRVYPKGSTAAQEGDPADAVGVVVSGRARVGRLAADGRWMTLETVGPGDAVGAVAALAGGRFPASIETLARTEIAWIPRDVVFSLLEASPRLVRGLVEAVARRQASLAETAGALTLDVPRRLAGHLFQRALASGSSAPGGVELDLGMSKTELAAALGTVPETLSRALARLRARGIIEVRGRTVLVRDVGALARFGAGYDED